MRGICKETSQAPSKLNTQAFRYFPISAQKLTVTKEMSNSNPYTMTIKNNKFVKLGMDSDWWEFPALCGGILLLVAGAAVGIVMIVRRKRRMEA